MKAGKLLMSTSRPWPGWRKIQNCGNQLQKFNDSCQFFGKNEHFFSAVPLSQTICYNFTFLCWCCRHCCCCCCCFCYSCCCCCGCSIVYSKLCSNSTWTQKLWPHARLFKSLTFKGYLGEIKTTFASHYVWVRVCMCVCECECECVHVYVYESEREP